MMLFWCIFTPKEKDKNKVIVLTNEAVARAKDTETGDILEKKTSPKTTKLEDDEIATMSSDGRVE